MDGYGWHGYQIPLPNIDTMGSLSANQPQWVSQAQFPEEERLLQRVERAAHPFAALGLTVQQLQASPLVRADRWKVVDMEVGEEKM